MSIKKIVFFITIIIFIFIINNLIHSIYTLWQKNNLVINAKIELEKEQKENRELKKQLSTVNDPQFVEEEARDKLFMTKPGEGIIIVPTNYISVTPAPRPAPVDSRPNWKKWWELFF